MEIIKQSLYKYFGYSTFKSDLQRDAVQCVIDSKSIYTHTIGPPVTHTVLYSIVNVLIITTIECTQKVKGHMYRIRFVITC